MSRTINPLAGRAPASTVAAVNQGAGVIAFDRGQQERTEMFMQGTHTRTKPPAKDQLRGGLWVQPCTWFVMTNPNGRCFLIDIQIRGHGGIPCTWGATVTKQTRTASNGKMHMYRKRCCVAKELDCHRRWGLAREFKDGHPDLPHAVCTVNLRSNKN